MHPAWLEPWWLERQLDPDGPDFVPGGWWDNLTHRSWLRLGTLGGAWPGVVDPRGLVTPGPGSWSLDWWVGGDDRWHLPSREVAVRQRSLGPGPVVETSMRLPGGDVVHRAYGAGAAGSSWLVVEVENRTAVPVAVALAVRPAHPLGRARVGEVVVGGTAVEVDGALAVALPRPPGRAAVGSAAAGDVLGVVVAGEATADLPRRVACPEGRATAAVVYPLPHTATLRVAVPAWPAPPARGGAGAGGAGRGAGAPPRPAPAELPGADEVLRGWARQLARGARIEVPDERLARALASARAQLLLACSGEDLVGWPGGPPGWVDTATVLGALGQLGLHDEVVPVLAALPDRQRLDGGVVGGEAGDGLAANGAALHAVGRHWLLAGDDDLVESLVGPLAKAGRWIDRRRAPRRGPGLADVGVAASWWSARGLLDAAAALRAVGQPDVADDLGRVAAQVAAAAAGRPPGDDPAGLLAGVLDLLPPEAPALAAAAAAAAGASLASGAVVDVAGGQGLSPRWTAWLAVVELAAGDPRALDRLGWLLDVASPHASWPELVHPRTGQGSAGDGHHVPTTAQVALLARALLAREVPAPAVPPAAPAARRAVAATGARPGGDLVLASLVPPGWLGAGWEVHGLPTTYGTLGYAVRWHGERPALLWELDPHPGTGPVRLRAPGLDPAWSSGELRGEALLAPVPLPTGGPAPGPPPPEASSSFG